MGIFTSYFYGFSTLFSHEFEAQNTLVIILETYYLIDMIIKFILTYDQWVGQDKIKVKVCGKIARRYISSKGFILDLIPLIPLHLIILDEYS